MLSAAAATLTLVLFQAHEIGTSRVNAHFRPDAYVIEIVTDGTALVEKLEAAGGRAPVSLTDPAELTRMLRASEDTFRKKIALRFDGAPSVRPEIEYTVVPAIDANSAPAATIRLAGRIPEGAQRFTWSFGWTYASYAFTARGQTTWLEGGSQSKPLSLTDVIVPPTIWETALRYVSLGFTHIVPLGLDHILFVLGLYLLNHSWRAVLLQVSAFTIAHSITLGLSIYGLVNVSSHIVEPLIALSILYVAIENILVKELKPWRVALVFGFGLLHGLGFAGVLTEVGLPRDQFIAALLSFNVGVEAGQLAVITFAFLLFGLRYSGRDWYRGRIAIPASLMIALMAVYWTYERVIA
jgi:hydrogenase/urease accessory protein HupE